MNHLGPHEGVVFDDRCTYCYMQASDLTKATDAQLAQLGRLAAGIFDGTLSQFDRRATRIVVESLDIAVKAGVARRLLKVDGDCGTVGCNKQAARTLVNQSGRLLHACHKCAAELAALWQYTLIGDYTGKHDQCACGRRAYETVDGYGCEAGHHTKVAV